MKMPNFASRYQSGTWYRDREAQSARNCPFCTPRSTSASNALRGPSYFALALIHASARDSALLDAVGSVADCALAQSGYSGRMPRTATRQKLLRARSDGIVFSRIRETRRERKYYKRLFGPIPGERNGKALLSHAPGSE